MEIILPLHPKIYRRGWPFQKPNRAGKAAFGMTEQFAHQQMLVAELAAIDGNEGPSVLGA